MHGGTPTTVGKLAEELGLQVEQVLDGCRQAGLSTFGAQTPLDGREADRVRAVLGGGPIAAPPGPWQQPDAPRMPAAPPPPPPAAAGRVPQPQGLPMPPPAPTRRSGTPAWAIAALTAVITVVVAGVAYVAVGGGDDGDDSVTQFEATDDIVDDEPDDTLVEPTVETAPPGMKFIADLVVGDCWSDPNVENQAVAAEHEEVDVVRVMPCDQAHQAEVYFVDAFVDPPGTPFLGNDRLLADAEARCVAAWEGYVGVTIDRSVFNVTYTIPTERSWLMDDRGIQCSLYPLDGTLLSTGARGSGR